MKSSTMPTHKITSLVSTRLSTLTKRYEIIPSKAIAMADMTFSRLFRILSSFFISAIIAKNKNLSVIIYIDFGLAKTARKGWQ